MKKYIASALSHSTSSLVKEYLLEQLDQAPDSETRLELFKACINSNAIPSYNLLNKLMWDADLKITMMSIEMLGNVKMPDLKQALYSILDSEPEPRIYGATIRALGQYGDEEDLKIIMPCLESKERDIVAAALWALGFFPPSKSLTTLSRFSHSKDETILKSVIESFTKLKSSSELIKMLYSSSTTAPLKVAVISGLRQLKDNASIPTLLKKLGENDPMIKIAAARSLDFADMSAVDPLINEIEKVPAFYQRILIETIIIIGKRHKTDFITYAEKLIKNKVLDMTMGLLKRIELPELDDSIARILRMPAGKADLLMTNIGKILKEKNKEDPLFNHELILDVLNDPDQDIRNKALKLFEKTVYSQKTTSFLIDDQILAILIEVIGHLRAKKEFENLLCHLLSHQDKRIVFACLLALGKMRSTISEPYLKLMLNHPDESVRVKVIECIGTIGFKVLVQDLVDMLQGGSLSKTLMVAITQALGNCGIQWTAQKLVPLLGSKDEEIQMAALEALAKLHDPGVSSRISPLVENEESSYQLRLKALETNLKLGVGYPLERISHMISSKDSKFVICLFSALSHHPRNERFFNMLMEKLIAQNQEEYIVKGILDLSVKINEENLYNKIFTYFSALL